MRKILFVAIGICGFSNFSFSQNNETITSKSIKVNPCEFGESDNYSDNLIYMPSMATIRPENGDEENELLEKVQAEKTVLKLANLANNVPVDDKKNRMPAPLVGINWKANINVGTPPDNAIAVNTKGQIVSFVNSNVKIYSSNGTTLISKSMALFFKTTLVAGQPTNTSSNQCDPKVIFDCEQKRFVALGITCDGSSTSSRLVMAFSKEEDPTKGWWCYAFNTDVFGAGVWFDYPRIGVSATDFFVSGNMFTNNGNFIEAYVFQLDKMACYNGSATPATWVHHNIGGDDFSLTQVNEGLCSTPSAEHYMVSSNPGANNSSKLSLYTVNGKATDATSPTISHQYITTSIVYSTPGYAVQPNTSVLLKTGDARMQDAYIVDGTIHCAFQCDAGGGYSGIHYSRLKKNGSNWTCTSKKISASNKEMAYPSICNFENASTTGSGASQGTIIGFLGSSSTEYPNMKVVSVDNAMAVGNIITVKTGDNFVDYGLDTINNFVTTRWGDYIGVWRQHFNSVPTVWMSGMYGDASNTYNSWSNHIVKLTNGPEWLALSMNDESQHENMHIYPNPSKNSFWQMEINATVAENVKIILTDVMGKQIDELMKTNIFPGKNIFQFNTASLSNGVYFVKIIGNQQINLSQRLLIQH